jgi:VWFA-related protein
MRHWPLLAIGGIVIDLAGFAVGRAYPAHEHRIGKRLLSSPTGVSVPSFRIPSRYPALIICLSLSPFLNGSHRAGGRANDHMPPTAAQSDDPFRLKVSSNLVVVRVVVRDAQGKPVGNLEKKDFRIFDRGKEQSISQFEVETSAPSSAAVSGPIAAGPAEQPLPRTSSVPAGKFLAFYFDDLNSSDADMIQARDAAGRYQAADLQPNDRVAVFTSSEMLTAFSSDPKQIHDALHKLRVSARALNLVQYCPNLSDYQALQITEGNQEALAVALDEAAHCDGGVLLPPGEKQAAASNPSQPGSGGIADAVVRGLAQSIANRAQGQARASLQQLEQVVTYCAQMPGERSVILVSPGFLSQSEQFQLDRLIDHALRAHVVISALDPKGLATLMREVDTTTNYIPINPKALERAHRMDSQRELVATAVLADVAQGTGGEFFHNSNDLKGGFAALAGSPIYYILAFSPTDIRKDGKFHPLKIALAEKERGFSIQARRGYFAFKEGEDAPEAGAEVADKPEPVDAAMSPEAKEQQKIREAVISKTELQQLPVTLDVKPPTGQGDMREVAVSAHLAATLLPFRKEGDQNRNTVTFVFAVFDEKDNLMSAQQRQAKVSVPDGQLQDFLKAGVSVNVTFQLKPGTYRLREVVTDSEDHQMTTQSHDLEISANAQPEPAPLPDKPQPASSTASSGTIATSASAPLSGWKGEEARLYADAHPYMDEAMPKLKKTVHELGGVEPATSQEQLSDLLSKVGLKADDLLHRLPNLACDEVVNETQWTEAQGGAAGCSGEGCLNFPAGSRAERNQKFSYMILTHQEQGSGVALSEYRAGRNGKPVEQGTALPYFQGFITNWLVFSSLNQAESHFRYLGRQKTDGHDTFVIGFAQIPGSVESPGQYMTGKESIPMLLQGVAWVDQSDFRIVRLRTDLLAPQPGSQFQQQTSNMLFGPVRIASHDEELWLPQSVEVKMEASGQFLHEQHQYSKYRLYQVNTKIVLSPQ